MSLLAAFRPGSRSAEIGRLQARVDEMQCLIRCIRAELESDGDRVEPAVIYWPKYKCKRAVFRVRCWLGRA